ncbi:MAG: 4-hydroxythreonine-4-phosphate dehydrogenase PdxA [Cyanobacteria bacterium REEB459]|nr:4-hydroxythreonine-4-phosphate dehydrogenase PdxA [Cyanobacteria bacterium REEB459]
MAASLPLVHPRPRLALTLGDPAGIGPEVVFKALAQQDWSTRADITVFGTEALWQETLGLLALDPQVGARIAALNWFEVAPPLPLSGLTPGLGNAATGAASFSYLSQAIAQTLAGNFDAIVTAPIAKSAWHAAGHTYPGQTELLAEKAGVSRFAMGFVARSPHTHWVLRMLLATTHMPLHQVPGTLTPELLTAKLRLLIHSLERDFGLTQPRIAVAGLNPHSGEGGQLGWEEQDLIIPWLEQQRQRYPQVKIDGPVPADTLWVAPGQAWFGHASQVVAHDAYLALYHDQGLIPVKLMAFDRAVNLTLGLPFIRTSPDHGTAFDIAGQGLADPSSLVSALSLAIELTQRRLGQQGPWGVVL